MLRKGPFSPPFLTLPLIYLPSPSPFPTLTPTLSRPRIPSFSRFESVRRSAGDRRDGEGWKGREKEEMEKRGWREGERRRDKRVKGEGERRKTAPPVPPPLSPQNNAGIQIFLVQLNGAPLCKAKLFWVIAWKKMSNISLKSQLYSHHHNSNHTFCWLWAFNANWRENWQHRDNYL